MQFDLFPTVKLQFSSLTVTMAANNGRLNGSAGKVVVQVGRQFVIVNCLSARILQIGIPCGDQKVGSM